MVKSLSWRIFHSEMVVGAPSADTAFTSTVQEAYWRSIKGYDAWAQSLSGRQKEFMLEVTMVCCTQLTVKQELRNGRLYLRL